MIHTLNNGYLYVVLQVAIVSSKNLWMDENRTIFQSLIAIIYIAQAQNCMHSILYSHIKIRRFYFVLIQTIKTQLRMSMSKNITHEPQETVKGRKVVESNGHLVTRIAKEQFARIIS